MSSVVEVPQETTGRVRRGIGWRIGFEARQAVVTIRTLHQSVTLGGTTVQLEEREDRSELLALVCPILVNGERCDDQRRASGAAHLPNPFGGVEEGVGQRACRSEWG